MSDRALLEIILEKEIRYNQGNLIQLHNGCTLQFAENNTFVAISNVDEPAAIETLHNIKSALVGEL